MLNSSHLVLLLLLHKDTTDRVCLKSNMTNSWAKRKLFKKHMCESVLLVKLVLGNFPSYSHIFNLLNCVAIKKGHDIYCIRAVYEKLAKNQKHVLHLQKLSYI